MADQLFNHEQVLNVGGQEMECVGVSYEERDGERVNHAYTFRLKSDMDAERQAAAEAAEKVKAAEVAEEESK